MPQSVTRAIDGSIQVTNGIDPALRWDGLLSQMEPVGVPAPTTAALINSTGAGGLAGTYFAYVRFIDENDNPSSLSPISNSVTIKSSSGNVVGATNATPIQITTDQAHELTDGATVVISGVQGNTAANGKWTIKVVSPTQFNLVGTVGLLTHPPVAFPGWAVFASPSEPAEAISQGAFIANIFESQAIANFNTFGGNGPYLGGGTWINGGGEITYSDVPIPTDQRIVRRQILRNTDGQAQTFYVDIDTSDLSSTEFSSTQTDLILANQEQVPLLDSSGNIFANRYGIPPDWMAVGAAHLARQFLAVNVEYSQGSVSVVNGSLTVQGIGTEWPVNFAGRFLWIVGATASYQIDTVDPVNQIITLLNPYTGATDAFSGYTVRPAIGERKLIYYSESGLPQAWNPENALSLQEDGDELTCLMPKSSFLYLVEQAHIYRFTFQSDPAADGYIFLSANRGCINNRCWVTVEDTSYMLDYQGVHAFSGGGDSDPISAPIGDLFEPTSDESDMKINWSASDFFHCVHSPQQETIRWFVALSGSYLPFHALAYAYRTKRWWIEEFAFPIGGSALGKINNVPQLFLGGPAGGVYNYGNVGYLDGPDPSAGTVRGQVTGTSPLSLTDNLASFPVSGVVGAPVTITEGTGKGQKRLIVAVSGQTLTLETPWLIMPDATSTYQIGGINWLFRTGWFRWAETETEGPRRLEIVFQPTLSATTLDARLFLDRAATPLLFDTTYTSADANQFASNMGQSDLIADMTKRTGFVQKRLDGFREFNTDGPRFVQVEIAGVSNQDRVSVFQMSLDGAIAVASQGQGG